MSHTVSDAPDGSQAVAAIIGRIVVACEELNQLMRLAIMCTLSEAGLKTSYLYAIESLLNCLSAEQMRQQYDTIAVRELVHVDSVFKKPCEHIDKKIRNCLQIRNIFAHSAWAMVADASLNAQIIRFQRLGRTSTAYGMMESRDATLEDLSDCFQYVDRTVELVREVARFLRDADRRSPVHRGELALVLEMHSAWYERAEKPQLLSFAHQPGEHIGL